MADDIILSPELKQAIYEAIGVNVGWATKLTTSPQLGDRYRRGFEIDCGTDFTVTFDKLKRLSEVFGTEKIDINNYVYSGGYCETCAYEEARVSLQIYEPTKNIPMEGLW